MNDLQHLASTYREVAIFTYQQHGRLYPKLWVESEDRIQLIEPTTWEACGVSDWDRVQMVSACMRATTPLFIGRTDEVYIRDMTVPGALRGGNNLADLVDTDPSIRSALMVHAVDLRSTETYLTMATFDLDNEGLPYWERHEAMSYYEMFAIPLWASAKMVRRADSSSPLSVYEAEMIVEGFGWAVTRLDK